MSDSEIEKKFCSLVAGKLPAARCGALLEQLWKLEDVREIGALIGMTATYS
jgi:hypothetical protein